MHKQNGKVMSVFLLLLAAGLFSLDQFTKYMAVTKLKGRQAIPVIRNVFELSYVENRGAAFGILQNRQWLFVVLTAAVMAVLFWLFIKMPAVKRYIPAKVGMAVLAAGALGNLFDRVRLGYVVDFFYFKWIDFPVFNMADIYVVASVIFIAFLVLFYYREEELDGLMKG